MRRYCDAAQRDWLALMKLKFAHSGAQGTQQFALSSDTVLESDRARCIR